MSEKHTPAPWWATDHGVRDRGGYIAHMNSVQRYEGQDERYAREVEQHEADKRLIAAAPKLLAALKRFESWADSQSDAQSKGGHATFDLMLLREERDAARAAIKEVEGS